MKMCRGQTDRAGLDFKKTQKLIKDVKPRQHRSDQSSQRCRRRWYACLGTGAKFGHSFGLTTCGRPQLKLLLLLLFHDLGLRPISATGLRKLQPNLAPTPYLYSCAKQGQWLKWESVTEVDTSLKKLLYVWTPELISYSTSMLDMTNCHLLQIWDYGGQNQSRLLSALSPQ